MDKRVRVALVAVPETAGSALYGMKDVLLSAGNIWQELVRADAGPALFSVSIVSPRRGGFLCGNDIPVKPDFSLNDAPLPDLIILPELWLGPDESLRGRYNKLMDWIRHSYRRGAALYSACSGSLMLAESGLLDGCPATSHWGYQDLFRSQYPHVDFRPEPNLVFADKEGRIVTAGGTTSWHDLALHIIARYASPQEAMRIAKVYLLKWHGEGQLPFAALVKKSLHSDALVKDCERQLQTLFSEHDALTQILRYAKIPERTLKRRFKGATGCSLIEYIQNLRIEEAKRLLEVSTLAVEEISPRVGYEDTSFFRRLFKRLTGLPPRQYRQMFKPIQQG